MRTLTSLIKLITIAWAAAALFACSSSNNGTSPAVMLDNTGNHPANWVQVHKNPIIATGSVSACTECHGSDLQGGISQVTCFSTNPTYSVSGYKCHFTSPGNVIPTSITDTAGCVSCHGGANGPTDSTNTQQPNRQFAHGAHTALSGVTCDACHLGAGAGTTIHAKATATGGYNSATVNVDATQFTAETPGATFGYTPASGTCSSISCHGNGGNASKLPNKNPPLTIRTLPWQTGKIDMTDQAHYNDCFQCHESGTAPAAVGLPPTPQYNSFYSIGVRNDPIIGTQNSLHDFHIQFALCADCHNINAMTDNSKHFSGLSSHTFTDPGATIGSAPTKVGNYDKATKTCSNTSTGCHSFNHPGVWQ